MKEKTTFHERVQEMGSELENYCMDNKHSYMLFSMEKGEIESGNILVSASINDMVAMLTAAIDGFPGFQEAFGAMLARAKKSAVNGVKKRNRITKLKKES